MTCACKNIGENFMFNSVNNPFGQRIESALSTSQDKQQRQEQKKEEEKRYLEDDDQDEVQISELPELSEDDVIYLSKEYFAKLKSEHSDNEKVLQKIEKYIEKFDVKKFMKRNPGMTPGDFHMIMYNETASLLN